jgi:hypothetical protein
MVIPLQIFPNRFLATDFNTGTITVTLQIPLHYSTYKVFKSHVKASQVDFLYSSVFLKLTACLLAASAAYYELMS